MLAAAMLVALATACAIPDYKALSPEVGPRISATQVVIGVSQAGIYAENRRTTPEDWTGGILGAPIAQGSRDPRHEVVEAAVGMARRELAGFDVAAVLQEGVKAPLSAVDWLHVARVTVVRDVSPENYGRAVSEADERYSLVLDVDYHFTAGFDRLVLSARTGLFPRGLDLGPRDQPTSNRDAAEPNNALYSRTVEYVVTVPASAILAMPDMPSDPTDDLSGDERKALLYWSEDGGANLKRALQYAAVGLGSLVAMGLQDSPQGEDAAGHVTIPGVGTGAILRREAGGRVIFVDDGTLISTDSGDAATH